MGWNPINDLKHEWHKIKDWLEDRVKKARKDIDDKARNVTQRLRKTADAIEKKAKHADAHIEDLVLDAVNDVEDITDQCVKSIRDAGEDALDATEQAIQQAIDNLISGGYKTIIDKLLELSKHATKGKKARVALVPFWFEINLGDKVEVLQRIADNPPTDPRQIPDLLYDLVDDDEVGIGFRIPVVGKVEVPVPINVIKEKIEELL